MKLMPQIKKKKVASNRIDKSLNKYKGVVLFPEKLEKANEMLKTVGIPKDWK